MHGGRNSFPDCLGFGYGTKHDFGAGLVGHDIWRAASGDGADVQRARTEKRVGRQRDLAKVIEHVEKRVNRGATQLGISRVRKLAARADLIAERTFATKGETIFRGLSVDQK